MIENGEIEEDLSLYFFKRYMKIVTGKAYQVDCNKQIAWKPQTDAAPFNIDGWEEVWEYERTDENGHGIGIFH